MRWKILKLFLFFSLLPVLAQAQEEYLAKIEATYQNTQTLEAEFVQSTYVSLLEKTVTRPGRIFFQKGGKLRIEYAGDKMTHYITDGKMLWVLDPKTKDLQSYDLKDSGLPEEALKFMTELGSLRKYFKVERTKSGAIQLHPKKKTTYRSLICQFGEDFYLKDLVIYNKTGNTSTYRFFKLKTGHKLSPKLFQP